MNALPRLLAAALLIASLGLAHAQGDPNADPPGRAARLSEVSGQVWFFDQDAGEWVEAVRNRPITAGDHLATDAGARAELQLGSTSVRLDGGTELEVSALDDSRLALHLASGSVMARVPDLDGLGALEIDTDEGRFPVLRNGSYRVDRDGSTSRLSVYSGQARYEGPNSGLPVNPGQRAEFWIDSGGVAQYGLSSPVNDAFTAWSSERDRLIAASAPARYVSPEMTGAEELDRYGRWEQSPDYGPLWVPTAVAADWAPYREGHWAWVAPWGWTWVDDAPWGFAPFHYGRWVHVRNNWCWTPGQRVARPVYAPALVAWVGGPRANIAITVGGGPAVGWFPLAPREVYVPSYRVSPRYAQNINISYVGNADVITRVFENPQAPRDFGNRRWPGAVTVVPAGVLTSRQPVAPAWARMRQNPAGRELANQPPGRGVALIAPPVAAPPPMRHVDPRDVRPPPGFAERPAGPRPGLGGPGPAERDRDGRGRDVARPESPRPPPQQPGRPPMQPVQPMQRGGRQPPVTVAPPVVAPQAQSPIQSQIQQPQPQVQPPRAGLRPTTPADNADRRDDRRGDDRRRGDERGPAAAAPAPAAIGRPQVPTTVQQGPAPAQQAPMMRALPVQRGEERRAAPPQPQQPPIQQPQAPQPPQAPRFERPSPPAMQQAPRIERPAAPAVQTPAPVVRQEPPRVAPAVRAPGPTPAPETQRRPEGPQQQGGEQRRGGDPREQQR
jgi:hypothetical protein